MQNNGFNNNQLFGHNKTRSSIDGLQSMLTTTNLVDTGATYLSASNLLSNVNT